MNLDTATLKLAELVQLPRPVMRARTGFHTDHAGTNAGHRFHNLASAYRAPEYRLAVFVDAMHTEYTLCQVDADGSNEQ